MTDSIKLVDLPIEALTAIALNPVRLDDEAIFRVADELKRRATQQNEYSASLRKVVAIRQRFGEVIVAPG